MADVVGYSRLMERDEAGTHARLRELREKLFDPKIAEHGGRVVHTSGDGMLLEFPSATSAMRCAVEVQQQMAARNLELAPDKRIELRAGINLGDIIVDGDDIIGDGVNVAQRLEALAEPGGICVASAVLEQVREDLGVEFIDVGEQRVKNISRPIRVFRIAGPHGDRASAPSPTSAATEPSPRSIMIVPFRAPPDDGALRSFADTLASDLARILSDTMHDVHVVLVDATSDRGKPAVADHDLKTRYIVEGELRASGDEVIIITRFVDAVLSKQVGSDRRAVYHARLAQEQEQLTLRLMYAIREHFENAERHRSAAAPPPSATAQELVDRARALEATRSGDDLAAVREVRKLYDLAIARDPSLSAAWSGRAGVVWIEFILDYTADRAQLLADMDRDSVRGVELDPQDPAAWAARHLALQFTSRFDAAFAASDRAQALDPAHYFFYRGFLLVYAGRAAEALALIEARNAMLARTDLDLDTLTCDAHLHLGNYRQAIVCGERAAAAWGDNYWNYLNLTAAYAQVGDMARAAAARDELMRYVPEFTIARFKAKQWSTHPTWAQQTEEHLIAGLRKAGVPE
jgi:adenylate cyclase